MEYADGKVKDLQIAYIGGGSRGWAWTFMTDLAMDEELSGTIRLYDIDAEAAKHNEIIGNRLSSREDVVGKWNYTMVRIDGKLYYDTGRESIMDARCGTMDGEITSTVDGTEIPTEDNQSNFGSGFGYQYGADDTIEIYMNEKWFVFEYREESE